MSVNQYGGRVTLHTVKTGVQLLAVGWQLDTNLLIQERPWSALYASFIWALLEAVTYLWYAFIISKFAECGAFDAFT